MTITLRDLESSIIDKRHRLDIRVGEYQSLAHRRDTLETQIADLKDKVVLYDKAIVLLNSIGEERQEAAQRQIETLVTKGLQTIFGSTYSFHVIQTRNGKRSEVDFVIRSTFKDGRILDTPAIGSRGLGMASVVGVLLRIVILLLDKKDKETILGLDESFANLSERYRPAMGQFLKELSKLTGVQILLVSHHEEFIEYADKVYELSTVDDATQARELSKSDY